MVYLYTNELAYYPEDTFVTSHQRLGYVPMKKELFH
jgi:hypothetical protein